MPDVVNLILGWGDGGGELKFQEIIETNSKDSKISSGSSSFQIHESALQVSMYILLFHLKLLEIQVITYIT